MRTGIIVRQSGVPRPGIISPCHKGFTGPGLTASLWFSGQLAVIFPLITGGGLAGQFGRQSWPLYQRIISILEQTLDSYIEI